MARYWAQMQLDSPKACTRSRRGHLIEVSPDKHKTEKSEHERCTGSVKKKHIHLMSHNTTSIASILKIRLGLDSQDFKLDYDTIKSTSRLY